jgi:structural maintenance of chromosome 4
VGPNGSGKSNVIDALLFVFGKKAKKLRMNKVSELIHKSNTYPNLKEAHVAVYFQNIIDDPSVASGCTVVEGSQLCVKRVACKDNSSKYYLNGKSSTFGIVTEYLRTRGIDLDNNRFLILQGEVEQIAMMKPKGVTPGDEGLLEYLEDIIGSNKYVEEIEKAEKVVEELTEVRGEKLNRLKIVEKEKNNLEGPKVEAEEYLKKELLIASKQNVLYQMYIAEAQSNVDNVKEKHGVLKEKQDYEQGKLKENEKQLSVMEKTYNKLTAEYEVVEAELETCKRDFIAFERKDINHKEDVKHTASQIKKLQATQKKEAKKCAEMEIQLEEAATAIPKLEEKVNESRACTEREAEVLEEIRGSFKPQLDALRVRIEEKQGEMAPLGENLNSVTSKKDTLETEIKIVEDRCTTAKVRSSSAVRLFTIPIPRFPHA